MSSFPYVQRGPYAITPTTDLPVHGKPYFCPIARCETLVDGVKEEGDTLWFGCHACRRIPMEDGRVLVAMKQWHPATRVKP